jgi:hypothetical protein
MLRGTARDLHVIYLYGPIEHTVGGRLMEPGRRDISALPPLAPTTAEHRGFLQLDEIDISVASSMTISSIVSPVLARLGRADRRHQAPLAAVMQTNSPQTRSDANDPKAVIHLPPGASRPSYSGLLATLNAPWTSRAVAAGRCVPERPCRRALPQIFSIVLLLELPGNIAPCEAGRRGMREGFAIPSRLRPPARSLRRGLRERA